ncbi:MAG: hypothetical protein K8W52_37775 [Deltaproteobacteria bacterium]|nr:hypothetical protein [Deltaproteobacteria bacterium]
MTFFNEIKTYIGFGPHEAEVLAELRAHLAPRFPEFAEHFYQVILTHARAAAAITGGPAQVARLEASLESWMESGLAGPHDEVFYERRARIGRIHVVIGLPQEFMFTAMNVMRMDFHGAIDRLTDATHSAIVRRDAIDKLFDLELAIMLRYYQRDSEAVVAQRERRVLSDRLAAMQALAAGLAHEVRNPLNAAKLQLELLERRLRRTVTDERLIEPATLVQHEIARLTELLNELLDFARPARLTAVEHDLVSIARHVIELERPSAVNRGASLELEASTDRVLAWVDAGRIHQIILNLVKNAVEAVRHDGHVVVRVATAIDGGAAITVSDDGGGIPPEVLARIYEPFFSTKEAGTGLGMPIVHSLVELHNGQITVATGEHGTEFTVTLPPRAPEPDVVMRESVARDADV